jgi:hypothetical protein
MAERCGVGDAIPRGSSGGAKVSKRELAGLGLEQERRHARW